MAHQLFLTDGISNVSLTTSNVILNHYVPETPKRVGPGVLDFENVTESIEVTFSASTTAAALSALNYVERLLVAARLRQLSGLGNRVYLKYQPINDTTMWRSEVMEGSLRLGERAMTTFGQAVIEATITITRAPWWEGDETSVPLSNGNGSDNTSGLTIYNHDDADTGHDNWVQIAANEIEGVLPTPVKVTLTNNTGASQDYRHIYMATNAFSDPANLSCIIEGESSVSGGTVASLAGTSGGQYLHSTLPGTTYWHFTLSTSLLTKMAGRFFRVLGNFISLTLSDVYATAQIRDQYGLIILSEGEEVLLPTTDLLADLGALPFPPGGYNTNWAAQRLVIKLRSAAAVQVSCDFLQLTPLDSWRLLYQRGYQAINGSAIVDDGIEQLTYLQESGKDEPIYTTYGQPLYIFPSSNPQRLIILHDEVGSSPPGNTFSMKVAYRPRRLTL
jgi:hypothetical protein